LQNGATFCALLAILGITGVVERCMACVSDAYYVLVEMAESPRS